MAEKKREAKTCYVSLSLLACVGCGKVSGVFVAPFYSAKQVLGLQDPSV